MLVTSVEGRDLNSFNMEADHYRTVKASLGNSPFKQGYERQDFSDLLLTTQSDGLILRCHRVILAAFSGPMRRLFLKHPNPEEPVVVPNVDYNSLHYIVKLIYNGSVKIKRSDVESFAQAIRSLDFKLGDEVHKLAYEDDTEDANPPQAKKRLLNKTIEVTAIKSELSTPKIDVFGLSSPSTSDGLSTACRPLASANQSFASSSQSLASGSHHFASVSLPSAPEPPPPVTRTISAPARPQTGLNGTGLFRGREGARKYNDLNLRLEICTSRSGEEGRRRLIDPVNNRVVDNLRLSAADLEVQDQTMSSSQEESQHPIAAVPEYNPTVAPPAWTQRGTKRPYGHNAVQRGAHSSRNPRGAPNIRNPRGAPNRRGQPRPLMATRLGPPVNTVQMIPPVNASVSAPIAPQEEIILGPLGKFWLKVTNFERRREEHLMSVFRGSSTIKLDYNAGEAYIGFDEAAILRKNIQDYQNSNYNPEAKRVPDKLLQFNGPSIKIIVENLLPLYQKHGPFEKLLKKNDIQFLPGTISLNG